METDFESARNKYRSKTLRYLLIAEAPPSGDRFFYFENVPKYDNLFVETMKVLYVGDWPDVKNLRQQKMRFLQRFRDDGFFLIDALTEPMQKGLSESKKRHLIAAALPFILKQLAQLVTTDTKIILVSS